MLASDELGQVFGLLRLAAVAIDLIHAQIAVRAIGQAHRGTGARDFLHGHHMRQIAHVGAAILLGYGDAEHAQFAKLAPHVHRELVASVDLCCTRSNLALGKFTHRVAQRIDVFTELEVQSWQIGKAHGCLL